MEDNGDDFLVLVSFRSCGHVVLVGLACGVGWMVAVGLWWRCDGGCAHLGWCR